MEVQLRKTNHLNSFSFLQVHMAEKVLLKLVKLHSQWQKSHLDFFLHCQKRNGDNEKSCNASLKQHNSGCPSAPIQNITQKIKNIIL